MRDAPSKAESAVIKSQGAATARALKRLETQALRDSGMMRKLTPEVKLQMAKLIATGRGFAKICNSFGVSTASAYAEARKDPAWKLMLDEARLAAKENLEESLYDRAVEKDTTAGIFMLKAMDPDRYGDKLRVDAHHRFEINVSLIPADEPEDATGDVLEAEYAEEEP
jgi:hypothetical protein